MISFSLIARNCEDTLPVCLRSIKPVADQIVLVDSGSSDSTVAVAESFGAKIGRYLPQDHPDDFLLIPDEKGGHELSLANFAAARNLSFAMAKYPWIFWLDSVTGETPVLVRKRGEPYLDFMEIRDLMTPSLRENGDLTRQRSDYETLSCSGWTPIHAIKQHWISKPIYRIIDDGDVRVTGDHSLMTGGSDIAGKDVRAGTRTTPGTVLDHIHASKIETPGIEPITRSLAEAWGFFAAEGSCSIRDHKRPATNSNRYLWSVSNTNRSHVDHYARIFSEHHARTFYIVDDPKPSDKICHKLYATDPKDLCLLYRDRFYSSAGRKKIPKEILNGSQGIIEAFLRGYEAGDGHVRRQSRDGRDLQAWVTNSPLLAAGLIFLYQRIGRDLYCNPERRDKPHTVSCIERSGILTRPGKGSLKRKIEGVRHVHVERTFEGYVYDLNTEDGTFVGGVGQFVLHNSDDELGGLNHWWEMLRQFEAERMDGIVLPYEYAFDERGRCITKLWRERLVRWNPAWQWEGHVHETLPPTGRRLAAFEGVRVIHHKDKRRHPILRRRNLEILKAKASPDDPRTLFYLGTEHTFVGEYKEAVAAFTRYLTLCKDEEETYQALFYLGDLFRVGGQWKEAIEYYQRAILVRPTWRIAYFGLAAAFGHIQDWDRCLYYIEQGRKQPAESGTLLAHNPKQEQIGWAEWAVNAYRAKGDLRKALEACGEGLREDPRNATLRAAQAELSAKWNDAQGARAVTEAVEFLARKDRAADAGRLLTLVGRSDAPIAHLVEEANALAGRDLLPGRSLDFTPLDKICMDARLIWMLDVLRDHPRYFHIGFPGCGDSALARLAFYNLPYKVEAWDPDATVVARLAEIREWHHWPGFFRAECRPLLQGPTQPLDAVVLSGVLEHSANPAAVMERARQWVRPGGRILVIVPNGTTSYAGRDPSAQNLRLRRFMPDDLRKLCRTDRLPFLVQQHDGPGWLCLTADIPDDWPISPRTIGIVCPPAVEPWGPHSLDTGIGGSEESVIRLSRVLSRRGHRVLVYGPWRGRDNGRDHCVEYRDLKALERRHDLLVAWRVPEAFSGRRLPEAEWLWLWLHDTLDPERVLPVADHLDAILVGSNFHASLYPQLSHLTRVQRYGVDPAEFQNGQGLRDPHKFVWTSCPTRGLETLLDVWPRIRAVLPEASLHIFYDFVNFDLMRAQAHGEEAERLQALRQRIRGKADQAGVHWRGRVNQRQIAEEMSGAGAFPYTCVAGDTPIDIPRDYTKHPMGIPIRELVGKEGIFVWSLDIEHGQFNLRRMQWCRRTRSNAEVIRVTWEGGSSILLTPDHLVLTYKRGWIQARDLSIGESVVSLKKHAMIQVSAGVGKWPYEHRMVAEALFGKIEPRSHVDHKDGNPLNNSEENIQLLSKEAHARKSFSGVLRLPGAIRRTQEGVAAWRETESGKRIMSEIGRKRAKQFWNGLNPSERRAFVDARNKKRDTGYNAWWGRLSAAEKEKWSEKSEQTIQAYWSGLDAHGRAEHARRVIAGQKRVKASQDRQARDVILPNHKVARIENAGSEDVYDMEVEEKKNYVGGGVVVHNCNFPEIACISAAKAQAAGCWPVFYPVAALSETIAWGWQSTAENFVEHCIAAATGAKPESEREAMRSWAKEVYNWERVALGWEQLMRGL